MKTTALLFLAVTACVLCGCASGNFTGPVTPVAGQDPRCNRPASGLLAVEGKRFVFEPDQRVVVMSGKVEADGALHATLPARDGNGRPAAPMQLDAVLQGHKITGTLLRGGCRFDVDLTGT